MLDTNAVSRFTRRDSVFIQRMQKVPPHNLCISTIIKGELLYGLAKNKSERLNRIIRELIESFEILSWDEAAAKEYGSLRADLEQQGKPLAPLDMLIAAHAISIDAVLVTNDRAFTRVPGLTTEDWTLTQ